MGATMRDLLQQQAFRHRVTLSEGQIEQFIAYLKLVQQWQKRAVRLVGTDTPAELVGKHVADALSVYNCIGEWGERNVIDIGSGAGFPGLCLRLIEPRMSLSLLEASGKKVAFLRKVKAELGLEGVRVIRGRAEELAHDRVFREVFDVATMRGVVGLARGMELGIPYVRVGGLFVLVRGRTGAREVRIAEKVGGHLGGGQVTVYCGGVGEPPVRGSMVVVRKVERTDGRFPEPRSGLLVSSLGVD